MNVGMHAGVCAGMHAGVCAGMHACWRASYVVYANALRYVIACIVFLDLKIFVCLIKQASLLAIISKFGGGDNNILWLSFAQQT
jgi:hypothetical protein